MGRWVLAWTIAAGATVVAVGLLVRGWPLPSLVGLGLLTLLPPAAWHVRRTGGVGAALAAFGGVPWLAVPIWVVTHPAVHVDNATGGPVDVWVDGKRVTTIAAHDGRGEPPHIRVPLGSHRLGWSPVGAARPTRETDAQIRPWGEALYNPASAGCHWLAVTVYGRTSTHGHAHGPQSLLDFQPFDDVDVWLGDPPEKVRVPPFLPGTVRVSLQRWGACMDLLSLGCDVDVRRTYVGCMRAIDGHAGVGDCWGDALRSCSSAPNSSTAGSAKAVRP